MTNNLKAERTLTAEELQTIIDGCEGVTLGPWYVPEHNPYSPYGGDDWPLLTDSDNAGLVARHISRLDPDTVKAMASMALQSLSTQQPMGEVTDELRYAFRNADNSDWEHLFAVLPDTGRGKFWKAVFKSAREALHPNQESGE